ncbi:universal stress protein [Kitasatospora cathayae]|uniref:Universal stress protein n=1 Tax=Kitasatospora cathayae TaxID=3004092 RepID=A0ABY7Q0Z8_9ACTN|nr:universal stress protein [Kitasatospora sp. HUAS 3-15]WBP86315.1 universal stress protein [Kitasatospora sp. HUAS 3-15]
MADYLLAAIDGSAPSIAAARWAADEATRHGLPLRLVHAQTWLDDLHADPGQPADVRALTTRMLSDAKQAVQVTRPSLEIRAELIGGGEPVDVLVDAAADADLLVVGRRRRPHHHVGMRLGPVAHAAIHHAQSPVAVVPHD